MGFGEIDVNAGRGRWAARGRTWGAVPPRRRAGSPGLCVTTEAFRRFGCGDGEVPGDVAGAITAALAELCTDTPVAVRSSSTAEDLPAASFAGQHDSFLDVTGPSAVIDHVRRAGPRSTPSEPWPIERAKRHRRSAGRDGGGRAGARAGGRSRGAVHRRPPTSNRTVSVVEAVRGSGDAVVFGPCGDPDRYLVRDGEITELLIAGQARAPTDDQVRRLAVLGRRIELDVGSPQDVEWCLVGTRSTSSRAAPSPRCTRSRCSTTEPTTCTSRSGTSR